MPLYRGSRRLVFKRAGASDATQTTAFLARTSGLDATHTNAYKAFINGMVSDAIWSNFDAIYIISTKDITTAKLNLVSTSFNMTDTGVTFVADRGATNAAGELQTGFTPSTAGGVYVLNDAHISVWANGAGSNQTDVGSGIGNFIGMSSTGGLVGINQGSYTSMGAGPAGNGLYLGQRTASNAIAAFTAAPNSGSVTAVGTAATASTSLPASGISICNVPGVNNAGRQLSAASIGKSMSSGDIGKYYTRLQAFMTAVGN